MILIPKQYENCSDVPVGTIGKSTAGLVVMVVKNDYVENGCKQGLLINEGLIYDNSENVIEPFHNQEILWECPKETEHLFKDLEFGRFFVWGGVLYVKTGKNYAVALSNIYGKTLGFVQWFYSANTIKYLFNKNQKIK